MAKFWVLCGSKVSCGDKFCFKCGAKVLSGRESISEEENALSSFSRKPMSQFLTSKAQERCGFFKVDLIFAEKTLRRIGIWMMRMTQKRNAKVR